MSVLEKSFRQVKKTNFVILPFVFWLFYWLSFDLRILITIVLSGLLWFTASDYPFGILDLRLLITPLVF
jgi:hypothetical protein